MPEVRVLQIACWIIPITSFFYFWFDGKNPFYGLLIGLGISTVLFFGCALGWHIEDTKKNRQWKREKENP